ncbi:helix-turn-helix transcriptional regulator [Bradyrhizobium pachyrhizi]|uniref:helix-turn-helix transcriptional regulator n=1 Tax=Bradyrhizobium pachyrhizi TaxID=280333 RepID=UPI0009ECA1AC|nr:helix-turn-helix domain-containing protein [Bradyrhizobium pachyrhizi]
MPNLLSSRAAAPLLGLSPRTLERYRCTGDGPAYVKAGRRVLYRPADLEAWITTRLRHSTSEGVR